jgi:hypothetical protein
MSCDDLMIVGPAGQVIDKKAASALAAVPKAEMREVQNQLFGNVALVTGIQEGVGANSDQQQRFTFLKRERPGGSCSTPAPQTGA